MEYTEALAIAGGPNQLKRFLAYDRYVSMRESYDRKDWVDAFVNDELGDWFRLPLLDKFQECYESYNEVDDLSRMRTAINDYFGK